MNLLTLARYRNNAIAALTIASIIGVSLLSAVPVSAQQNGYWYDNGSGTVTVTVVKYVNGAMATASSSNSTAFPISALTTSTTSATTSSSFTLAASSSVPYKFVTNALAKGSGYKLHEVTDTSVVGASCAEGKPFALQGYSTGSTLSQAATGTKSLTAPDFTNLMYNKYVVVWNQSCTGSSGGTGTIGGDVSGGSSSNGTLAVTSIESTDTSAVADGTFGNGLKYTFNITVPSNETNLSMKFSDWSNIAASSTFPVANNMRISSAQADNAGATVLLTAANTYSSPALHITGDLDAGLPGRQVQVLVEVAVPAGTVNGSYTTSYGVQTLP